MQGKLKETQQIEGGESIKIIVQSRELKFDSSFCATAKVKNSRKKMFGNHTHTIQMEILRIIENFCQLFPKDMVRNF